MLINRVYGSISKKNVNNFFIIDKGDIVLKKYDQVFSGIKHHVGRIDNSEVNYNTDHNKIKFLSDDSLSLDKLLNFPTLTVIIRCVVKQNGVF